MFHYGDLAHLNWFSGMDKMEDLSPSVVLHCLYYSYLIKIHNRLCMLLHLCTTFGQTYSLSACKSYLFSFDASLCGITLVFACVILSTGIISSLALHPYLIDYKAVYPRVNTYYHRTSTLILSLRIPSALLFCYLLFPLYIHY